MPNVIKYSTGATPTGCLRKGNMLIGNNTADYGLTFFNGIDPPSGGYTIYLNKASGGPSIYCPANDTQLIGITNQIAGTSYTTAAQCLDYFATQTDKIVVNINYEGIVTNGLVLNLDAGFRPSYPTTSSIWYDLSGNANNGTLINGPTYSSANSGSIVFDSSDDYYIIANNSSLDCVDGVSVFCWCKMSTTAVKQVIMKYNSISVGISYGFQFWEDGYIYYHVTTTSGWKEIANPTTYSTNTWYYVGLTYNKSTLIGYTNGSSSVQSSHTGNITINPYGVQMSTGQSILTVSDIQIYNRALSATEVLQNYNAQKGRFGL